jgi:hypothetical protein
MGLRWRPAAEGGMGSNGIVGRDSLPDDPVRLEDVAQIIQIDRLVFKRALQTFNEGVGETAR